MLGMFRKSVSVLDEKRNTTIMFQIHLEEMRPKVLAWDMDKHVAGFL
jgi:hypothetical protein